MNIEDELYAMALDVIGKAVFNYEFGALQEETPLIKAVYRVLRESEHRSTFPLQYWNIPGAMDVVPRQKQFKEDIAMINDELSALIAAAMRTRDETDLAELEARDYANVEDASLLRFLVDIRGDEATGEQLRDDLMTMLIAGHETTAAVLTWTMYLLATNPEEARRAAAEVDAVVSDPGACPRLRRFARRAHAAVPGGVHEAVPGAAHLDSPRAGGRHPARGEHGPGDHSQEGDGLLHRGVEPAPLARVLGEPGDVRSLPVHAAIRESGVVGWNGLQPDLVTGLYPNEQSTDFAYVPFGGGQRRCAGDMFAMMEATVALSVLLKRFDFELACDPKEVEMITGATIHTKAGMPVTLKPRAA